MFFKFLFEVYKIKVAGTTRIVGTFAPIGKIWGGVCVVPRTNHIYLKVDVFFMTFIE